MVRSLIARFRSDDPSDRGDVPGWVMVTLMTATLVVALWAIVSPELQGIFRGALDSVKGGVR